MGAVALALVAALAAISVVPMVLSAAVFGLSILAYLMYWIDKSAAKRSGRRIAENTLLLAGLAGGWPGALIAQQQFHHKTIKQPFQTIFWGTAAINVAAVVWLVKSGIAIELARALGH